MEKTSWIKVIVVVCALILIVLGFAIGYYSSKTNQCKSNPLTYAIEKLEKRNNANFSCSCVSLDKDLKPFYFDDKEISNEPPILKIANQSIK